jgi:hypothetical protein
MVNTQYLPFAVTHMSPEHVATMMDKLVGARAGIAALLQQKPASRWRSALRPTRGLAG